VQPPHVLSSRSGQPAAGLARLAALLGVGVLAVAYGCASPTDGIGEGGSGGSGGGSGGSGAGTTTSSSSTTSSTSSTTTTTTSSTTTSTSTGPGCGAQEHLCGGVCAGNTPATGCYTSASCAACTEPPNGAATCSAQGTCDAICDPGYQKVGAACQCASQCCTDADCAAGQTCSGGTCTSSQSCDMATCLAMCIMQGMIGACINDQCICAAP